jgi:DGQHR domain-containing protein
MDCDGYVLYYIVKNEKSKTPKETKMASYHYPCLVYRQRLEIEDAPIFCLFHAPVGEIMEWATIKQAEEQSGTLQRQISLAKVDAIKKFLTIGPQNIIPGSVVIVLDKPGCDVKSMNLMNQEEETNDLGLLEIEMTEEAVPPGFIIDGQHRVLGMLSVDPKIRINVVALLNADETEKALQFMVINYKIFKMSSEHIEALAQHKETLQLDIRPKTTKLELNPNFKLAKQNDDSEEDDSFLNLMLNEDDKY